MRALECTQKGEPEKEAATLGTKEVEGSELVSVHTRGEGTPEDRLTTPSGRIREAADHCWPRVASSSSQHATRGPHHLSRVARTRSLLATRGQQTVPAGHAWPPPEFLLATRGQQDFRWPRVSRTRVPAGHGRRFQAGHTWPAEYFRLATRPQRVASEHSSIPPKPRVFGVSFSGV